MIVCVYCVCICMSTKCYFICVIIYYCIFVIVLLIARVCDGSLRFCLLKTLITLSECITVLGIFCECIFLHSLIIFYGRIIPLFVDILLYIVCIIVTYDTLNVYSSLADKIRHHIFTLYSIANLNLGCFGGGGGILWYGLAQYGLDNYVFPSKQSGNRFRIRTGGCNFFY